MKRNRYSLTKRPTSPAEREKKRSGRRWRGVWYVQWKLPGGGYSDAKSTGYENKSDAIDWCEKRIAETRTPEVPDVKLDKYAAGFYDWPDGRYARDRRAGGHRVSYRSAQSHRVNYSKHIKPVRGSMVVCEIGRRETRGLRDKLFAADLAPSTINHIVDALSIILQAAEEDEIIAAVPRIYRASGGGKSRGVLTPAQVDLLFSEGVWRNTRERLVSLVAAKTGIRQSAILGLTIDRIGPDHIEVQQVWDRNEWRLRDTTKNGEPRIRRLVMCTGRSRAPGPIAIPEGSTKNAITKPDGPVKKLHRHLT